MDERFIAAMQEIAKAHTDMVEQNAQILKAVSAVYGTVLDIAEYVVSSLSEEDFNNATEDGVHAVAMAVISEIRRKTGTKMDLSVRTCVALNKLAPLAKNKEERPASSRCSKCGDEALEYLENMCYTCYKETHAD